MKNEDQGSPFTPDASINAFLDGSQEVFDQEHRLLEPPRPQAHSVFDGPDVYCERRFGKCEVSDYVPREKSIDEKIDNLERSIERNKKYSERSTKGARKRHNFGQDFEMVGIFEIDTEDYSSKYRRETAKRIGADEIPEAVHKPEAIVALQNRVGFYRYLQQIGLILIDDTGLSKYASNTAKVDISKGYVFIHKAINRDVFYAFEDAIRELVPMSDREIELRQLLAWRDENIDLLPSDLLVDERQIRELVDQFSLDERFVLMFSLSDELAEARRSNRRVEIAKGA